MFFPLKRHVKQCPWLWECIGLGKLCFCVCLSVFVLTYILCTVHIVLKTPLKTDGAAQEVYLYKTDIQ